MKIGYYIVNRMFCCVQNTVKFRPSLLRKLRSPTDKVKSELVTSGTPCSLLWRLALLSAPCILYASF